MEIKSDKWVYGLGEDVVWFSELCDSKEECVNRAKEAIAKIKDIDEYSLFNRFHIGQIEKVVASEVNMDFILGNTDGIVTQDMLKAGNQQSRVYSKWQDRCDNTLHLYRVFNVEEIKLGREAVKYEQSKRKQ